MSNEINIESEFRVDDAFFQSKMRRQDQPLHRSRNTFYGVTPWQRNEPLTRILDHLMPLTLTS